MRSESIPSAQSRKSSMSVWVGKGFGGGLVGDWWGIEVGADRGLVAELRRSCREIERVVTSICCKEEMSASGVNAIGRWDRFTIEFSCCTITYIKLPAGAPRDCAKEWYL